MLTPERQTAQDQVRAELTKKAEARLAESFAKVHAELGETMSAEERKSRAFSEVIHASARLDRERRERVQANLVEAEARLAAGRQRAVSAPDQRRRQEAQLQVPALEVVAAEARRQLRLVGDGA
jgi:hypothetical protein